jgi:3-carboxy-cis,cis-muconate cycloisomerase
MSEFAGDPGLVDAMFGTNAVSRALSDEAHLAAIVRFERALASAQAQAGVISPANAGAIDEALARFECPADRQALFSDARKAGTIIVPLAKLLTEAVHAVSRDAAGFVHFGATSQDAIDTANILQLRAALDMIIDDARRLCDALIRLADTHRHALMLGRTLMQPATPITFGLKAAQWLTGVAQAIARISQARRDALVLQFGGAAGTLGSLGDKGAEVATLLGKTLDLPLPAPALPWHTRRGALASLGADLGILCATTGKIARDLSLMMQFEVAEAFEAAGEGRGGSSAMPHKRNPVRCMIALANATRAPGLVAGLLAALVEEHERALGAWQAEWAVWPDLVRCTAGGVAAIADAMDGLVVDPKRMRANFDALGGLPMTEVVSLALAPTLGRAKAQALVEAAAKRVSPSGVALHDALASDPQVTGVLDAGRLSALLDPANALGSADVFITRALDDARMILAT